MLADKFLPRIHRRILLAFVSLAFWVLPLVAQPAIESVEKIEVVAGKPAVLTLRGQNFREIRRIDQVRIGDQEAEVLDWVIFNDQAMRLEIRIPSDLAQGVHSLSLRIYTANAEQWLEAQFPGRSSSGPEIELSYNNVSIVNGQSAPVTVELSHTGAPPILEFLLANRGDAPLDLGEPALPDWLTPAEAFPQQVGVGKSTFFFLQVQGTPGNTYRGMVEFTNNDPDENPFRFPVQVTIVSPPTPRLEILLEGLSPLSGPLATVRFGSGTVGAVMQKTLTIKNSGTALLSLSNPTLPPGFRLIEPLPTRVAVGEEIALPIALNTDQPGDYEGTMSFQTNDPAWNPVRIHLIGQVTTEPTPQAEVWQGNRPVAGESSAMVSFDTTEVGMPIARTFTLRNIGAAPLAVSDFRAPPGFRIMENLPDTLLPGEQTRFTLQLPADSTGTFTGTVRFATNVPDQPTFAFSVQGTVVEAATPAGNEWPWWWIIPAAALVLGGLLVLKGGGIAAAVKWGRQRLRRKGPRIRLKAVPDFGKIKWKRGLRRKKSLEIRLKPVLDFGKPSIQFEGDSLIKKD